ncbi:hypothetical protein Taro_055884 [Colocasia esculenta]|uniref:Uncharacterized protein n=1 Tax=Colocasia esculenta TaxID=4460 RepID=A0A843XVM4_COLES|nr:hypothetical protein [Colocasia esculenta]
MFTRGQLSQLTSLPLAPACCPRVFEGSNRYRGVAGRSWDARRRRIARGNVAAWCNSRPD